MALMSRRSFETSLALSEVRIKASSPLSRYKRTSSIRGAGGQMYVSAIGSSSAGAEVIVDYFVQSRRWQDTQCPGLTSRKAGASTRQRASA